MTPFQTGEGQTIAWYLERCGVSHMVVNPFAVMFRLRGHTFTVSSMDEATRAIYNLSHREAMEELRSERGYC